MEIVFFPPIKHLFLSMTHMSKGPSSHKVLSPPTLMISQRKITFSMHKMIASNFNLLLIAKKEIFKGILWLTQKSQVEMQREIQQSSSKAG